MKGQYLNGVLKEVGRQATPRVRAFLTVRTAIAKAPRICASVILGGKFF